MTDRPGPSGSRQVIEAYGDGGFRVSGVRYDGSVLILPDRTDAWDVADMAGVNANDLSAVLAVDPPIEFLLLGCGTAMASLAPAVREQFRSRGVAVDVMDTGAACRTYNVLAAEERRVAAALIAVN